MDKCTNINSKMRSLLIDWLYSVCSGFQLGSRSLHVGTMILDEYIKTNQTIQRSDFQGIGMMALFLGCKLEERYCPLMKDCVYVCNRAYTEKKLKELEQDILTRLDYNIMKDNLLHIFDKLYSIESYDEKHEIYYWLDFCLLDIDIIHKYDMTEIVDSCDAIVTKSENFWSECLSDIKTAHKLNKFTALDVWYTKRSTIKDIQ